MFRTRIKICGVTRPADARAAAEAGADAIGLIFHHPAPRNVSLDQAREILGVLPAFVTAVGVFVNSPASEILSIARGLGLRTVQLNGGENAETIAALEELTVIKALRVRRETLEADVAELKGQIARHHLVHLRAIVLEPGKTSAPGGTGVANDWEIIRHKQNEHLFAGLPALIAAGGLTPQNVGQVVRDVHPFAVDVSSGVEETPGEKSPAKIRAFVEAVRKSDESVR